MTKTFNFTTKKNNTSKFFINTSKSYSEILDDIIAADIAKKNDYLFNTTPSYIDDEYIYTGGALKGDNMFIKAATYLANYKSKKSYKIPFILNKMYTLSDGTPIIFYDDEIQIGFDTYKYNDFANISFLNGLTTAKKNIIINIYTTGINNIKINIL